MTNVECTVEIEKGAQQRGRQLTQLLLLLLRRRRLPTALQHSFDTLKGKNPSSLSISLK